jgi:hypothetical protein
MPLYAATESALAFRIGLSGHSDLKLSADSSSSMTRRQPISPPTASPPCESKQTRTSNSRLLPLDFVEDSRAVRNRALSPRKASILALSPRSTLCERTNCGTGRPLAVYFRHPTRVERNHAALPTPIRTPRTPFHIT